MSQEKPSQPPERLTGGLLEAYGTRGGHRSRARAERLSEPNTDLSTHPRPWTKLPRNRRNKLSIMGLGKEYLEKGDPRYKRAMELANVYRKARTRELSAIHGFVSAGVSALLATASLALAASRFLYEKAAETGDMDTIRKASALAGDARQAELAAWELCAREGMMKRKLDASGQMAPWLVAATGGRPDQARKGRKTNAERLQMSTIPQLPAKREATIDELLTDVSGRGALVHLGEAEAEGDSPQRVIDVPGEESPASSKAVADGDGDDSLDS